MIARAAATLVLALTLLQPSTVGAHDLDMNTARVSVRDGNVEIHALIDLVAWFEALADRPTSLTLSTLQPSEFAELSARARRQLVERLHLEVDGERVDLRLRQFPSDDEILQAAARNLVAHQLDDHPHRTRSPIVLEIAAPSHEPGELQVRFPDLLGDVLVSFVQPRTQLAAAGATSRYTVLYESHDPETVTPSHGATPVPSWPWLVLGAFIAGLGVAGLARGHRRPRLDPPTAS